MTGDDFMLLTRFGGQITNLIDELNLIGLATEGLGGMVLEESDIASLAAQVDRTMDIAKDIRPRLEGLRERKPEAAA